LITEDVNQLYKTTACEEDYINPTPDGMLSWRSIISFASYYAIGLDIWK
jgi:hypothetical protein